MAFITVHDHAALPAGKRASGVLRGVAAALMALAERQSRGAEIARLRALSPEELAARGLTQDRIVAHVFADRFCF
ncbi:MAG: hypothetical protein R3D78_03880 [Paracoccaceae bacterium]|jgi:hypothetical protein